MSNVTAKQAKGRFCKHAAALLYTLMDGFFVPGIGKVPRNLKCIDGPELIDFVAHTSENIHNDRISNDFLTEFFVKCIFSDSFKL